MYLDNYDGMIFSSLWTGMFTHWEVLRKVLFQNIPIAAAGIITQQFFLGIQKSVQDCANRKDWSAYSLLLNARNVSWRDWLL